MKRFSMNARALAVFALAGAIPLASGCAVDSGDGAASSNEALAAAPTGGSAGTVANTGTTTGTAGTIGSGTLGTIATPVVPSPTVATIASAKDTGTGTYSVAGQAVDGTSGTLVPVSDTYTVIHGRAALTTSGLSSAAQNAITSVLPAAQPNDDELIILPSAAITQAIAYDRAPIGAAGATKKLGICSSDTRQTYTKDYWVDKEYDYTKSTDASSGFSGSAILGAHINARVFANIDYTAVHHWYFGCEPIPVIHSVGVQAAGAVVANAKVNASFSDKWSWSTTVAQPEIGTVTLPIVPIPITFSVPIRVGIDADAKVTVQADGSYAIFGGFNLVCTSSGCTGDKEAAGSWTNNKIPTAGVTALAHVTPWAEAGLHAKVISDDIAYGEAVIRASLPAEAFAYAGNTCGDANGDGTPEFVSGASLDLKVALDVRAKAGLLTSNYGPWTWNVYNDHLGFWKLYDGGVFSPMFTVAKRSFLTATMQARMRPCFPYKDTANYQINWGDGSAVTSFTGAENVPTNASHSFATYGTHAGIVLTAASDSVGRTLGETATSSVNLTSFSVGPVIGGTLQVAN